MPSERRPLNVGSASTNFGMLLPESGVCGVLTDFPWTVVMSSSPPLALSQPALARAPSAPAAIERTGIEKVVSPHDRRSFHDESVLYGNAV